MPRCGVWNSWTSLQTGHLFCRTAFSIPLLKFSELWKSSYDCCKIFLNGGYDTGTLFDSHSIFCPLLPSFRLLLGTSPLHCVVCFLHNMVIFCYFGSFLVDSGRFQLTSTNVFTSGTGGDQTWPPRSLCSYRQPRGGCFSCSWRSPKRCAMPPTLFEVSSITCIGYLLNSHHSKC